MNPKKNSLSQEGHMAIHVANVSIYGNIALSVLKLLAGILAHSTAMISDAIHSASDVFSSIIVILGVRMGHKKADSDHPYGHERFESVAAIVLSILLLITGLFIGHTAIESLTAPKAASTIPGLAALLAAILSIFVKESMYWYTRHYALELKSDALMADAWHHRSDALSSVGALIGIGGARLGYDFMEPLASLVICLFIIKAAYEIFREAIRKMVDHACDEETKEALETLIHSDPQVQKIITLTTREFGNRIYVDLTIAIDGEKTILEGDAIAERIHHAIEDAFPEIKHISVKVKPYLKY